MVVTSPKTEHYAGGESRVVPLFPELRPHLEEAFERAAPGSEFVLTRCRDTDKNLRTHLLRIIRKAGLTPWPKLFQNLRSTRETELAEDFPLHVVCAWIGNSQPVAAKHCLQVTGEHFKRATKAAENALQNPVQQPLETQRNATRSVNTAQKETPGIAGGCDTSHGDAVNTNAPSWTRTKNLLIKSQLLCQLS